MECLYIGVDVGKSSLDIFYSNMSKKIDNSLEAITIFLNALDKTQNPFVICEATGGYEQQMVQILKKGDIAFAVVHPNKVRAFAKSKGILSKTDKMDAKILFEYASMFKPVRDLHLQTESEELMAGFLKRREQLQEDKFREQYRLDKILSKTVKKSLENHIKWIEKELENIEKEISNLQKNDEAIRKKIDLLTSVPSVGNLSASYLVCFLPELGKLNHKEIAALVGVAPFNRDSGSFKGKRYIRGGRTNLRKMLYMAALTSTRWCESMKVFYQRLKSKGKPTKVALTAVMRKLLIMLNSIVKRQTPWVENLLLIAA